jgi:hypothetical protein
MEALKFGNGWDRWLIHEVGDYVETFRGAAALRYTVQMTNIAAEVFLSHVDSIQVSSFRMTR